VNIKKNPYSFHLYDEEKSARKLLSLWEENNFSSRLWHKDWSLWGDKLQPEIIDRLGWLDLPQRMSDRIKPIEDFAQEAKKGEYKDLILIGMGGSSLAPEIFQKVFKNAPDFPKLTVCDSTHPEAVEQIRKSLDLSRTLFIVSSKSGTTLETLSLFHYFWFEIKNQGEKPGSHFIAITDYDTPLMKEAQEKGFRKIFNPYPNIGGRFSALTEFGLVPASLIGVDIKELCEQAGKGPDLFLGAALGSVGKKRDKLTFVPSKSLRAFPDWIEQLVAESLGKEGKGIIPVIDEPLGDVDFKSSDRFYIYVYLNGEYKDIQKSIKKTRDKKVPCVETRLRNKYDLGREIYNWETAVAAAGSYLNVHPFNQPNVQAAKDFTKMVMKDLSQGKDSLKEEIKTFSIRDDISLKKAVNQWISEAEKGDYAAVQVYLAPSEKVKQRIQKIRKEIHKKCGIATTMGYGPRFLHSTGQLHKGGSNTGLFLQLVDSPTNDIEVPGEDYSFGSIITAQSLGDFQALRQKGRRILRIDLNDHPLKGLQKLEKIIES